MTAAADGMHWRGLHSSSIIQIAFLLAAGTFQRLFYRVDRHCHFLNWFIITDVKGFIVFSRPGFLGHMNDSGCQG